VAQTQTAGTRRFVEPDFCHPIGRRKIFARAFPRGFREVGCTMISYAAIPSERRNSSLWGT